VSNFILLFRAFLLITNLFRKPKIPILTSPSSQAHELYKGLRPGSAVGDIYLNSKKFII
jgi:hypothetical protein